MSEIIIKVDGKKIEYFDNVSFSDQIDAVSSTLSFDSFFDIKTYEFSKVEVIRDGFLLFTGKIFGKTKPEDPTPKPFNYKCYLLTGILEDSALPLEYYPIQTKNKTLKEIVEKICGYFDITVKIDKSATNDVSKTYTLQDQNPDKKAIDIINKLCSQQNLILTHNAKGELIITKNILGSSVNYPFYLNTNKTYNYRNFYKNYVILGQQSIDSETTKQATDTWASIDEKRNITKIQSDGDAEITDKQVKAFKYDSYKGNTFDIQFHDHFVNVGSVFVVKNIKSIVNSITYNYKSGGETCGVSLLNVKVYERN